MSNYNNVGNRGNYRSSNNNYNQQSGYGNGYKQPAKKHSGCRLIKTEKGEFISAWKYTKAGMLSITANFWKKSPSANYDWEAWVVTIINQATGQKSTFNALYNPSKGTLRINDLNWVLNPKAPNGGYCGKAFSANYKAGRR